MAIINDLPGIEVSIRIDDQDVKEYEATDDDKDGNDAGSIVTNTICGKTKVTRKYIECIDGAQFKIHLKVDGRYIMDDEPSHSLNLACYVDGTWRNGEICGWESTFGGNIWEKNIEGRRGIVGSSFITQAFEFKEVKTVEDASDDQIKADRSVAKTLGTIEVKVFRVRLDGLGPTLSGDALSASTLSGSFEIAEKALKGQAISHGTGFSAHRIIKHNREPRYAKCKWLDKHPIAIFRFMYRSRKVLEDNLVLRPRNEGARRSTTLELGVDVDFIDIGHLSHDEIRRLARRQLLQQHSPSTRREFAQTGLTNALDRRPLKVERCADRKVIDLLDADD